MTYKTQIDFSEEDLQELMSGEEFTWEYTAINEKGKTVVVEIVLYNSTLRRKNKN